MECVIMSVTLKYSHKEPQFIDLKTEFLNIWKDSLPTIFEQNESHSKIFINTDNEFEQMLYLGFHVKNL